MKGVSRDRISANIKKKQYLPSMSDTLLLETFCSSDL